MKKFIFTLMFTQAICGTEFLFAQAQTNEKPNIVFILADDLGFADLSYTGSDFYQTPNIDNFANQGTYFDHAYSSHPTCQPSRLSLLTGKYPARMGAVSHGSLGGVAGPGIEMPASEVTIADALKAAGYTTCHIGKWHVGTGVNQPSKRGFDIDIASNDFCCPATYFYPYKSNPLKDHKDTIAAVPDLEDYQPGDYLTEAMTCEAVKFIDQFSKKGPFFLNLWYYSVHTPIEAEKDKIDKYKKLINPSNRQKNASYAAMVEHLDEAVGRVLKAIDDNNISENTIVLFVSDNGGANYQDITDNYPLRDGKVSQYEGGIRVPMIVLWPGITKPGTKCKERVIGCDIYPTLLAMTGVKGDKEHNKNLDGIDLSPLLANPNSTLKVRDLYWLSYVSLIHYKPDLEERNWPCGSIIKGDWKLMEFFEMPRVPKYHVELYNLKEDPSETTNLAQKMPEKVEELKRAMYKWRKDVHAPKFDMIKFYGETK